MEERKPLKNYNSFSLCKPGVVYAPPPFQGCGSARANIDAQGALFQRTNELHPPYTQYIPPTHTISKKH